MGIQAFATMGNTVTFTAASTAPSAVQAESKTLGGNQYRIINNGTVTVFLGYATTASDAYFRYNNDSGSNYSDTIFRGNGTTASSAKDSNAPGMDIGITAISTDAATFQTPTIIQIMNYANTTTYKTALIRTSNATAMVSAIVGLWRSTAAINEIDIVHRGTGWDIGSTAALYGIAAA